MNMSLPLCSCRSGELYEECCYKKKDSSGKSLFFNGAMTGDAKGTWHPLPNIRFAVTLVTQATDKYRDFAENMVIKSNLPSKHHKDYVNNYALFYQSYEDLINSLERPSGEGVSFQTDSIEVRTHWKSFLLKGRILLDFIGLHSRELLSLNQDIGGLNEKKYNLLVAVLETRSTEKSKLLDIKNKLISLRENILKFIEFRNEEKKPKDTIVEFPTVDCEHGVIRDGKLRLKGYDFNMIQFIKSSYDSIYKLNLTLLRA